MKDISVIFLSIFFSLITVTTGFSQTEKPLQAVKKNAAAAVAGSKAGAAPVTAEQIQQDVTEALAVIETGSVSGAKLDYNGLFKSSISGMLRTLDPHSNYFDAKESEEFRTEQTSRYYGIGATIGDLSDARGNVIATYIKSTFKEAPANLAGLRYGDKIVEVNGTSALGKPFSEVRNLLRGPKGTSANLVIERYGSGKRETVTIVRDSVPQPSISEAYLIRPGVGYIAMTGGFNQTTYDEFAGALRSLKARGMTQLVLDLKNNGGGLVGQAFRVANTFLSAGQIVFTQKGRDASASEPYRADNPSPETMPLVVLVNRNSASASEILAGALQDHDRALIVGENTFGKGLVQYPFTLDYGSMLLLTIAKYETPSGRLIQRDYSNGSLYDYYTNGGLAREDDAIVAAPKGGKSQTDSGRPVYGGGGITPDVVVKPDTITVEQDRVQRKLASPIFAFALDLAYGRAKGFESYKTAGPLAFGYDIKATDYPITESIYQAFRAFAAEKYKYSPTSIDKERKFVERALRSELIMAAYGSTAALQVFNLSDNQLSKAIDLLPQARDLAIQGARARMSAARQTGNLAQ